MTYEQAIQLIAFAFGIVYGSVHLTYIIMQIVKSAKK